MKIFTTITPAYDQVCEEWLLDSISEVEPEAEVFIVQFDDIHGLANFQAPDFNRHNIERNRCIREWISDNMDETIFITDADIVYFRPFIGQLLADLGDAKAAFARKGMDEGYNIGQMVLKCDREVLEFFERVGEGLEQNVWDEELVNELLKTLPLPRRNISRLFTDTSSWAGIDEESRMKAFSYHATETFATAEHTSLERKRIRINEVQAYRRAALAGV